MNQPEMSFLFLFFRETASVAPMTCLVVARLAPAQSRHKGAPQSILLPRVLIINMVHDPVISVQISLMLNVKTKYSLQSNHNKTIFDKKKD